jgi:hypothetical protein
MKKVIKLDDCDVSVTVREFRVSDVKSIIEIVGEVMNSQKKDVLAPDDVPVEQELDIASLLGNYDTIVAMLDKTVIVKGEKDDSDIQSVEDLAFSQVNQLIPVIQEVNASFFELMGMQNLNLKDLWDQTAQQ